MDVMHINELVESVNSLLAIIDKYGILISQWAWLYQALL